MGTKTIVASIVAVSTLAVASIAYATIPDGSGVIHGCYSSKDGSLRVLDTGSGGACDAKKETALDWNRAGTTGPKGPTGPAGTSHAYYSYGGLLQATTLGPSLTSVDQLTGLPAGTYVVSVRGIVQDAPKNQEAECRLVAGGTDVQETLVDTFATASPRLPFSLSAAVTLKGPGTIETDCESDDSGGFAFAFDVSTTAVAVTP